MKLAFLFLRANDRLNFNKLSVFTGLTNLLLNNITYDYHLVKK